MSPVEESPYKKKEFRKEDDEDLDLFLSKKDRAKGQQPQPPEEPSARPAENVAREASEPAKELSDDEHDAQISDARKGRAHAEAHHDVAVLRKKAHEHSHKGAQLYHKYRSNDARRQKCSSRAVSYREKAGVRRDKAKDLRTQIKEYDMELKGAAKGEGDLSPEALRNKMAALERKAAKADAVAMKYEAKAAAQTEKAAKYRTRAAKFLEKSKLHESEARMYGKRADNLEKL